MKKCSKCIHNLDVFDCCLECEHFYKEASADEMLEELGYKVNDKEDEIGIVSKQLNDMITFNKYDKRIDISMIEYLKPEMLVALFKKCEEMEWI